MALPTKQLQLDRTRIIFEQFEDETVLVNMESGLYYSVSRAGTEILRLLDEGCPVEALGQALFAAPEDAERFRAGIEAFVAELEAEAVLTARAADRPATPATELPAPPYAAGATYTLPVLERFDDVRDLLLIDPVHQIDRDYGWPSQNPENALEPKG